MKITQKEFVIKLAVECGVTETVAREFVDCFKARIYKELASGNSVELSGFGHFSVSHRAARLGVNPRQPSIRITIPKLNTPKFRAGEAFKEAVALK